MIEHRGSGYYTKPIVRALVFTQVGMGTTAKFWSKDWYDMTEVSIRSL
jgi:hypothetical protein